MSTAVRRRRTFVAAVAFTIGSLSTITVASGDGRAHAGSEHTGDVRTRDVRTGSDPLLTIVDQPFVLAPATTFELSLQMPTGTDTAAAIADGTVVVTSHRPITERTQVWDARAGSLPAVVDTIDVDIELDTGLGEPPVIAPTDVVERTPPDPEPYARLSPTGLLTIVIPTETDRRTTDALQFAQAGVHPVVVDVRRGDRTEGALVTFVDRLADPGTPSAPALLDLGFVMRADAPPTIGRDGSIGITDDAVAGLDRLADTLDALASTTNGSTVTGSTGTSAPLPALVHIEPAALAAAADATTAAARATAARLTPLLAATTLTAAPRLPLDAATAAAGDRQLDYARLLDEGAELLTATTGDDAVRRELTVVSSPLSTDGAELLEATGTDTLVMPYELYSDLAGSVGLFTDTTRALAVADTDLRLVIVDPFLAERLDDPGDDPTATAISIVAELLVLDRQLAADGARSGHGLVLARTDLAPIDADLLTRILTLADTTDGLRFTDPTALAAGLDTMQVDGADVVVRLPADVPPPDGFDPEARAALVADLDADTTGTASMLTADDPRIASWQQVTSALVSTVVDDELAAAMDLDVRSSHDQVRACVIAPERFSFTLTGRTSTIPFSITNQCDVPITVRVRLDSPKITFPEGDQIVELQPGTGTEVRMRADARTNGRSSVFLRLFTPAAVGTSEQLGPDVVLTARVQSFAGIGQLLLGTFVLVVAAWWIRQWRDTRRRHTLETNAQRHPASGTSH